jgi:predicted negative regulator of RcsB-dependent stress response
MDEEITIIDSNTRNEKIKNFFLKNRNKLITIISILVILLIGYFLLDEIKKRNKIKLASQYNSSIIEYKIEKKIITINQLINIVNKKDRTYSPLALYFLLDNELIQEKEKVNSLFDILINDTNLETEIENLIIYKKALFNANFIKENELINILSPIINSESIWKSHALYLLAEYFYSKNEKQKAKETFNQIINLLNANTDIKLEAQKRLNRDLGE